MWCIINYDRASPCASELGLFHFLFNANGFTAVASFAPSQMIGVGFCFFTLRVGVLLRLGRLEITSAATFSLGGVC